MWPYLADMQVENCRVRSDTVSTKFDGDNLFLIMLCTIDFVYLAFKSNSSYSTGTLSLYTPTLYELQ